MRPITVIVGIVLGSSVAITLSLGVVLLIYLLIGDPRMQREIPVLGLNTGLFTAFTAIAGAAFYGSLTGKAWRWWALAALAAALAGLIVYYWP